MWEFSHPKFVRDRPDLLDQIKRKTMESESLRREAGDLHANFVMLQVSHTDLVKRVHHLQENLAEVIRELAETRKRQATQEGLVRQLLQALKQGGAAASLPQDLDMDAIASQSTRPSIFISDHDTNSLLHPELGYSASMSALGSQFHLGSGSLIATSQPPTSPISTIGQIGTALHHSASAQPLSIGPAPQQQGPRVASPQQVSQQSLRSALSAGGSLGSDNLGVYPRQNSGSLATSQPTSPAPFYSGASNSLSTSSLSSTDMKDVYNR
ncbi:hypothetical protein LPJ79_005866 [Coemansia sp. RSA 1821]|nr:hypothetical protein LPJ79_005866 [Coemansia sp. RSA 1821]